MCAGTKNNSASTCTASHTHYFTIATTRVAQASTHNKERVQTVCSVQTKRVLAATRVCAVCKRDRNGRKCAKKVCGDRIAHMSINVILNKIRLSYTQSRAFSLITRIIMPLVWAFYGEHTAHTPCVWVNHEYLNIKINKIWPENRTPFIRGGWHLTKNHKNRKFHKTINWNKWFGHLRIEVIYANASVEQRTRNGFARFGAYTLMNAEKNVTSHLLYSSIHSTYTCMHTIQHWNNGLASYNRFIEIYKQLWTELMNIYAAYCCFLFTLVNISWLRRFFILQKVSRYWQHLASQHIESPSCHTRDFYEWLMWHSQKTV